MTREFRTEERLQNYLVANIKDHYPNLRVIGVEFEIPNGRIDILCKDTDYKNVYAVVELKKGEITSDSVVQVLRYTQYMNFNYAKKGKRLFYPLLIGAGIDKESNHLDKLLKYYKGRFADWSAFYCYYNLYDTSDGCTFKFIESDNERYFRKNYPCLEHSFSFEMFVKKDWAEICIEVFKETHGFDFNEVYKSDDFIITRKEGCDG